MKDDAARAALAQLIDALYDVLGALNLLQLQHITYGDDRSIVMRALAGAETAVSGAAELLKNEVPA